MKKLCYITTVHGTFEAFLMESVNYIKQNSDYNISVICSPNDDFIEKLPSSICFYPVEMKRGISIDGIRAMFQMKKVFKEQKFDLIQYSTPNASFYAALAGFIAKVPVRLYCQWGIVYVGMSGIKRRIFKAVEKLVCRLSTWVEPDSHGNLYFAHSEGLYPSDKGSVIGKGSACGVSLKKFDISQKEHWRNCIREKYSIPNDAFVIGFVGRITRDKGINELLASYRNISKDKKLYLMIVGREEGTDTLDQALFQWSKSEESIIYTGPTNVVEEYLSAMDCYVLPSYREGFGMGTIEAEAMGVPVIVTDIPGPTDAMVKGVTGEVVEKANVDSLAEAIIKLYDNPELCSQYGKAGYEFVKENFEQQYLFAEILQDRKRLLGE